MRNILLTILISIAASSAAERSAMDLSKAIKVQISSELKNAKGDPRKAALLEQVRSLLSFSASARADGAELARMPGNLDSLRDALNAQGLRSMSADLDAFVVATKAEVAQAQASFLEREKVHLAAVAKAVLESKGAADLDEPIRQITALESERQKAGAGAIRSSAGAVNYLKQFATALQNFYFHIEHSNRSDAIEMLSVLERYRWSLELKGSEMLELVDSCRRKAGVPTRDELQVKLKALVEKVVVAVNPSDIDAHLLELGSLGAAFPDDYQRPSFRSNKHMIDTVIEFSLGWQELIHLKAIGQTGGVRSKVEHLSSNSSIKEYTFIPHSRLLEMKNVETQQRGTPTVDPKLVTAEFNALIDKSSTVEELTAHLPALRTLVSKHTPLSSQLAEIEQLARENSAIQVGAAQVSEISPFRQPSGQNPKIADFQEKVRIAMARRFLRATGELAPKDGEKTHEFLSRHVDDAFQKKDWSRLRINIGIGKQFGIGTFVRDTQAAQALQMYLAGKNLEEAGVVSRAIEQYVAALGMVTPYLPKAEITERLAKLKASHPEEYQRTVSPSPRQPEAAK